MQRLQSQHDENTFTKAYMYYLHSRPKSEPQLLHEKIRWFTKTSETKQQNIEAPENSRKYSLNRHIRLTVAHTPMVLGVKTAGT